MWRLQEVVLQICATKEAAAMWYHMFSISTNFIGAVGLHFVLLLINKERWRERHYHLIALYLPTFLFSMFFASGSEYMIFNYTENWGWVFIPSHPISIAAFVLIGIHATLMILLLANYTYKIKNKKSIEYFRARLILFGSSTPIIVGVAYQIILPIYFDFPPMPIASSLVIFFSASTLIAITKFDFLKFSPKHQWDNIVENMNEGILIADNNNIIQYVNTKFCKIAGYDSSNLIETSYSNLIPKSTQKKEPNKVYERKNEIFREKYEIEMKTGRGKSIICEINSQPYLDMNKKIIGSIIIFNDVTKEKEAIKKIKESESKYRSFVENAADGIFIVDKEGNCLDINTKGCQMLGYTKNELLKKNIKELLLTSETAESALSLTELLDGKAHLSFQALIQKDGAALNTEINSRLLPNGNLLAMVRNISERIESQIALAEKVKEMDAFIYRASHDLRGPLASISGLTSLGKEEVKDLKATFYFEKIYDSVTRLDNILVELNKIARITQAKLSAEEIDLNKEVKEILESLSNLPNYSLIAITTDIDPDNFSTDKILLIIILQNLIINSINYYDENKEKPYLLIRSKKNLLGVEITIKDNGIGIPLEVQDKIFDMFFRGTNISGGSGLGLYIVKNAIKKLGGNINLESTEGEGTTFTITFPKGSV